ncbi:MAG TPA: hypothetical protein VGE40_00980, partial [Bacilli bacterium]
ATGFTVIFSSYGFMLEWGPIIWGLIGAALGFAFGLIIDFIKTKGKPFKKGKRQLTEVFVLVQCNEEQVQTVEKVLWEHKALGVGKLGETK